MKVVASKVAAPAFQVPREREGLSAIEGYVARNAFTEGCSEFF